MKVFICIVLFAAIAAAIPVENVQGILSSDLHKVATDESARTLSDHLIAPEPTHVVADSKSQTENSNRDKRFIFFKFFAPLPVVYAAPAPVVYSAPVVKTVVCVTFFT